MNLEYHSEQDNLKDWICPDIRTYWQLAKLRDSNQIILQSTQHNRQFRFSITEGYALQYFTGELTTEQIQTCCQQQFQDAIYHNLTLSNNLVIELLQKLIALGILAIPDVEPNLISASNNLPQLKACVQWIKHPDDYWILRNPEDVTFLQVSDLDKSIIEQLGKLPIPIILQHHHTSREQLQYLLQILTATAMFEGTKLPQPPKHKLNPLQLLSFKVPLFNPDSWLSKHVNSLGWIWTKPFCLLICFFLALSIAISINQSQEIFLAGQQIWANQGSSVILPFALLMLLVVSLHELGHAFTLKHYGGIVPEIGLLFMCLMPGCYTNTSDSYCLVKRRQRTLVVAAGVLVQFIIWAIALWMWNLSNPDTWLHTTSYLLMVAALFTVALNLNPMSKFDGYYLAVAVSGINNLRSRSFQFYSNLLRLKPSTEQIKDRLILAVYAPFSFFYILFVFSHLWLGLGGWLLANIPMTALTVLILWAIYFYFPQGNKTKPLT
ncbi:MAG: site-2 protease family protein [Coleofasciculaceae cyanobacterium]